MSGKKEMQNILRAALEAADAGDFERAQKFGEVLIRKLEVASVFKAGAVQLDNPLTLWIHPAAAEVQAKLL